MTVNTNEIIVDHVLFRKIEGTLHLTNKVITWKSNTENSPFTINYFYNKINDVKISYKKKIKILLVFHNMQWCIFEFISPISRDKQLTDMIKISDLLNLLKTTLRHKNKRNAINNQNTFLLYKNLVFYGNNSEDIFWKYYYLTEKEMIGYKRNIELRNQSI